MWGPCPCAHARESACSTRVQRQFTHFVVAAAGVVEHRVQFDVLQVYLQVVVARLALVKLDRGSVGHQRQRRQHRDRGAPPPLRIHPSPRADTRWRVVWVAGIIIITNYNIMSVYTRMSF